MFSSSSFSRCCYIESYGLKRPMTKRPMTIRPVIGCPGAKKLAFHNIIRSVVVFVPRPTLPIVFNTERRGEVQRWRVSGSFLSLVCRGGVGWGKVTRVEGVKKSLKKGRSCIPRCHQAGPKIPSRLNVREKVYSYISSLCCLWSVVQYVQVIDAAGRS